MADKSKNPGLLLRNAGIFNPVLVQAVGLCPVVAMATTLKGAALLAAVAAVAITLSEFLASAFLKPIPRWVRTGIYIIIGCALVVPFMYLIEKINPELFGTLGIYLPVMAVNSLLVLRCERFAVRIKPVAALKDGATASAGYAAVLLLVGALREIIGSGAIAGFKFWQGRTFSGLLLPFGGLLMIGFAGAALRSLISTYWPKYLDKKQPKPKTGKKAKPERVEKPVRTAVPVLPDLTPEETDISLDDISAEPAEVRESEPVEQELTEASAPQEEETKAQVQEAEPEEKQEAPVQIKRTTPAYTFEDVADDELDRLMNRSVDEIFDKEDKE